jgi:hypothetical protein
MFFAFSMKFQSIPIPNQASTMKMGRKERAKEEKRREMEVGGLFRWREAEYVCVWRGEQKKMDGGGSVVPHLGDKVL